MICCAQADPLYVDQSPGSRRTEELCGGLLHQKGIPCLVVVSISERSSCGVTSKQFALVYFMNIRMYWLVPRKASLVVCGLRSKYTGTWFRLRVVG